jgi:hypothetical protein
MRLRLPPFTSVYDWREWTSLYRRGSWTRVRSINSKGETMDQANDPMPHDWEEELKTAEAALRALRAKFEIMPASCWRGSIAYEAVESAVWALREGLFEAECYPCKPAHFRHWRDKQADHADCPIPRLENRS